MNILSWLALIFLTLAGYSAGAVLGFRTKAKGDKPDPSPSLLDTAMVVVLWITGITLRMTVLKPWVAVCVCLVVAIVVAFLLNRMQPLPEEGKPLPQ